MTPPRILIVDDHEAVRHGIRSLLSARPDWLVCGEAADGNEAVAQAKALRPNLVLMDISMPRMNGLEAARILRKELPESKIVLVSQNDPAVVRVQAKEVDAAAFVAKSELAAALPPILEKLIQTSGNEAAPSSEAPRRSGSLPDWLVGGGEMGAAMRLMDWSNTPLGPAECWSPALRMMAKFLLANRFPQLLWWGSRFCCLYNDAYIPILGAKHPWALGRPVQQVWNEIWEVLEPLIETPFSGGPATWMEDIPLEINRRGFWEETHFTIAYSPVPDETAPNGIGGVLATVHEISQRVVGDRRVVVLRDLGAKSAESNSAEDACRVAAQTLGRHSKDIPFALLYLIDPQRKHATLAAAVGVEATDRGCSSRVSLESGPPQDDWPLLPAAESDEIRLVQEIQTRFESVPPGPWADPPNSAAVVAIRSNISRQPAGFLVAGISPRLQFDDSYKNFLELVSAQIGIAIASARAYEDERKRAEALAEINLAKTTFFSNVSHEFRTPLTLMLGPVKDLLARGQTHLSSTAREELEMVNRNGTRLLRLVNTLLDFSRIEAGRVRGLYQATDLAAFTAELASSFRSATERAGLRFVVNCQPLRKPVYIDHDMWEKIVLNLISNAFKFTLSGEIGIKLGQADGAAVLRVHDTGAGIPPQEIPRLFERFHRVPNTPSRTEEGSGIGLASAYEMVKLHGGSMRVESSVGQGTTFIVSIPFGQDHLPRDQIGGARTLSSTATGAVPFVEEALRWLPDAGRAEENLELLPRHDLAPGPRPSNSAGDENRPRVLIADDNADMRQYLARLLTERYRIETVANGCAALEAVRKRPPDLVLSDVMMPALDGFGLLQELRSDPRTNTIPVILLSARSGEESRVEGLSAGADDYLVKPFSARELLARVQARLELAQVREESDKAVRGSEERYRTLYAALPVGAFVCDRDAVIQNYNSRAVELWGREPRIGVERYCGSVRLWLPDGRELRHDQTPMNEVLRTGVAARHIEVVVERPGGSRFPALANFVPLRNSGGEIDGVVTCFDDISDRKKMEEALRRANETLESQVYERTKELEERNADVLKQRKELSQLSVRLMQSQDEERRRIARELHDSAGQALAALGMALAGIEHRVKDAHPGVKAATAESQLLVQQLTREIRTTSYLLHPPLLDESGLPDALRLYVTGLAERSGLEINLSVDGNFGRLHDSAEMAIFRIVQESLTNVHRHSGSRKAAIRLSRNVGRTIIEIEDEGRGIPAEKLDGIHWRGSGVGIAGMRERVDHLGGSLVIESSSRGTKISIALPESQAPGVALQRSGVVH